jgi:5'-3' exonuclease
MGVPGFFAWIVKRYPKSILSVNPPDKFDTLYLDWNGGIHPVCRQILSSHGGLSRSEVELKMVDGVVDYLKAIVTSAMPQKQLWIAIDGIAPRAKMNQQRARRFKAAKDKLVLNEIRSRHKTPLDHTWDTNAITPGTTFMRFLCDTIRETIQTDEFFTAASFETRFSDAWTPMEGEHKIMDHIRRNPSATSVIYGLDADLIFLSIMSEAPIWLMREKDQFGMVGNSTPYAFMSIDQLRQRLVAELAVETIPQSTAIRDFSTLCFLLGNDFLPKTPCMFIRDGGIDTLISAYRQVCETTGCTLTHDKGIDFTTLMRITSVLAKSEALRLLRYTKRFHAQPLRIHPNAPDCEIEVAKYDQLHPHPVDTLSLGRSGWKTRYYRHFFDIQPGDGRATGQVVAAYLKTMEWTLKYYTHGVASWSWFYPHHHAPTMSDIHRFLTDHANSFEVRFALAAPLSPDEQLLCVLPPQSFDLLSDAAKNAAQRLSFYPSAFGEDCVHKQQRWQTIPNIPFIDVQMVRRALHKQNRT